ncbi:MAG: hypothetical protein PHX09_02055 [Clostridia bacterium]|nr:hypothetical protein [Clostridia bacterium]
MNNIKEFRVGDYFYIFGNSEGWNFVKLTKMNGEKPSQQFTLNVSSDMTIDYYDFNDFDCVGEKKLIIEKDCLLFNSLIKLASENIKDINGKVIKKIKSPKIVSDIPPKDCFQAKQLSPEKLELNFFFNEDSYQTISIINTQYDLRSQIDQRRSDYKEIILNTRKECFNILEKHLEQKQDLQAER